jgi:dTDP-4-amino-4,6-dideoxygalactose transaminase
MFGRSRQVPIIQDAAHAFLATDAQGRSGALSGADFTCYSFQAIKHLTTVDGGALICKDAQHTESARLLRWYGLDRTQGDSFRCSQNIEQPGFKFHMNDVAATIGLANLPEMQNIVNAHRGNALFYTSVLEHVNRHAVTLPEYVEGSSWWLYTLLVEQRDDFIAFMRARDVECSPVHRRNDAHSGFIRRTYGHMPLPGVDAFSEHEVAIPVGWWLSDDDRATVADAILEWDALQRP